MSKSHATECLTINAVIDPEPSGDPVLPPVLGELRQPHHHVVGDRTQTDAVVVSTYLAGEEPLDSAAFPVLGVECVNEFSYWAGLSSQWPSDYTLVNIERDMEFSDSLVAELVDCPHPLCAYPYQVYPTALGRYIYCATTSVPTIDGTPRDPRWLEPGDEWAVWSSMGFCKIAPEARVKPLDKLFWQWLEHGVNRVVCQIGGRQWHIHWPEVRHFHDYTKTPDHLW